MFTIEFRAAAIDDLAMLRKFDQQQIIHIIEAQLPTQATEESRNRKRLRPNQLAEWELRIGDFRVFYDVDSEAAAVIILAIGEKRGNKLLLHGEEYLL
jgi:mRNA-degrading endonuclease RelE of RelBE toxin-antitoxin system